MLLKSIVAAIIILMELMSFPALADNFNQTAFPSPQIAQNNDREDKEISISTFKITPNQLTAGQKAELTWKVNGAARVFINNDIDLDEVEVGPNGKLAITPLKTTSYILTAYDQQMIGASAVATINVHGQPPLPTVRFSADRQNILIGDKVTLSWNTKFANTIAIDNGIGKVSSNGSIEVEPQITTTYTLAATGLGGSRITNITITVVNSQARNKTGSPTNPK